MQLAENKEVRGGVGIRGDWKNVREAWRKCPGVGVTGPHPSRRKGGETRRLGSKIETTPIA
jgi:hypothetical protein